MTDQVKKGWLITQFAGLIVLAILLLVASIVEYKQNRWCMWLMWGGLIFCNFMLFLQNYKTYKKQQSELNKGE